tara:strand:- start:1505 stop:1747 length:243 start_codon:yes stop_codon:yes gene_type:complete
LSQHNHILNILSNVIKKKFQNENIEITLATSANDIEEWDSLTHMNLIQAIEEEFKIEFEFFEIMDLENIGELVNCIQQKM